uniref:Uncharacterized protein n=1 Tax=Caenorhabditis japonica TaxID=281687 RepID=A0A8R1E727_CAEJA
MSASPQWRSVKCIKTRPKMETQRREKATASAIYIIQFQVRDLMPVVDCEDSVCIKAVIKQPPVERSVCGEHR